MSTCGRTMIMLYENCGVSKFASSLIAVVSPSLSLSLFLSRVFENRLFAFSDADAPRSSCFCLSHRPCTLRKFMFSRERGGEKERVCDTFSLSLSLSLSRSRSTCATCVLYIYIYIYILCIHFGDQSRFRTWRDTEKTRSHN